MTDNMETKNGLLLCSLEIAVRANEPLGICNFKILPTFGMVWFFITTDESTFHSTSMKFVSREQCAFSCSAAKQS